MSAAAAAPVPHEPPVVLPTPPSPVLLADPAPAPGPSVDAPIPALDPIAVPFAAPAVEQPQALEPPVPQEQGLPVHSNSESNSDWVEEVVVNLPENGVGVENYIPGPVQFFQVFP